MIARIYFLIISFISIYFLRVYFVFLNINHLHILKTNLDRNALYFEIFNLCHCPIHILFIFVFNIDNCFVFEAEAIIILPKSMH